MMDVINKIKNVFKIGIKTSTSSNRLVDVEFQGKKQKALLYIPYGLFANPQDNLPTGLLADQGNEESLVAFVFDIENRADDLEAGEIAIGIPGGSAKIIFRSDGKIYFKIGDVEGGDFAARFNELKTGFDQLVTDFNNFITVFNAHVHTGVTTGAGSSGPPASPGSSSAATIDAAKIEEIEFPS